MPSALYKRARDRSSRNPHPLLFSAHGERQTSRQATKFLLCACCEQRFHRLGEDWVLKHCAQEPREFKLRELLLEHGCDKLTEDIFCFYCDAIPAIDADALCYFVPVQLEMEKAFSR